MYCSAVNSSTYFEVYTATWSCTFNFLNSLELVKIAGKPKTCMFYGKDSKNLSQTNGATER